MTLQEKFETKSSIDTTKEAKVFAKECEKIAEDFAIGFAEWLDCKYYQGEQENQYHKSIKEYRDGKYFTVKELLEIYKKEKGL